MDTLDTGLSLDRITVAVDAIEPYVLTWRVGEEEEGEAETTVLAVMKREGGVLLAMPALFLPQDQVDGGNAEAEDGVLGPSFVVRVPAVIYEGGIFSPTGEEVDAMVIDCKSDILRSMRSFYHQEEIIYNFDEDSPYAFPSIDLLLPKIREWVAQSAETRAAFYTPTEEEEEPLLIGPQPRRRAPGKASSSASGARPKRITTTSLAADMKGLKDVLPTISKQLTEISARQSVLEQRIAVPSKTSAPALGQTFSQSLANPPPSISDLARSLMPPPRTQSKQNLGLLAPAVAKPAELVELELEKQAEDQTSGQTSDSALARAVLAQSQALTTLVAQIAGASSDPMSELTGASMGSGTRGAATRVRLQAELAQHRGSFFQSVMQSMCRRMAPTSSAALTAEEMLQRGISGVKYLERFGGYGRTRDLGQLQYQVMMIFDFLMAENIPAAMDGVALLAVTLEQASLDGGRMELATLLCLQEDPPSSIFMQRQLASTSRAKSFAPLADQRWVTCALAFLKEMEVIAVKRAEMNAGQKGSFETTSEASAATPKAKPKGAPKRKEKGKGTDKAEEADA